MRKLIPVLLAFILALTMLGAVHAEALPNDSADAIGESDPLSLWAEDSVPKEMLITYMEAITDPESEDYIPPIDRVAVFDLDGTLFCETDPNYFDYTLLVHRVLEDPDYIDRASDFERETALKIVEQNETGASFSGLEVIDGERRRGALPRRGMRIEGPVNSGVRLASAKAHGNRELRSGFCGEYADCFRGVQDILCFLLFAVRQMKILTQAGVSYKINHRKPAEAGGTGGSASDFFRDDCLITE